MNRCVVCGKYYHSCGNCAPCNDPGGYARGCSTQECQECYELNRPDDSRVASLIAMLPDDATVDDW